MPAGTSSSFPCRKGVLTKLNYKGVECRRMRHRNTERETSGKERGKTNQGALVGQCKRQHPHWRLRGKRPLEVDLQALQQLFSSHHYFLANWPITPYGQPRELKQAQGKRNTAAPARPQTEVALAITLALPRRPLPAPFKVTSQTFSESTTAEVTLEVCVAIWQER